MELLQLSERRRNSRSGGGGWAWGNIYENLVRGMLSQREGMRGLVTIFWLNIFWSTILLFVTRKWLYSWKTLWRNVCLAPDSLNSGEILQITQKLREPSPHRHREETQHFHWNSSLLLPQYPLQNHHQNVL